MPTSGSGRVLRVEPARPEDCAQVATIWREGWREAHLGRVPDELVAVRTPASFDARTPDMLPEMLVALADVAADPEADPPAPDRVVAGFVVVHVDEVDQLYASGAWRRAGVGALLLAAAEERIARAGHAGAWLAVVTDNAPARAFYARQGWRDDGPFDHEAPGPHGPVRVPCHRYVKDLAG